MGTEICKCGRAVMDPKYGQCVFCEMELSEYEYRVKEETARAEADADAAEEARAETCDDGG